MKGTQWIRPRSAVLIDIGQSSLKIRAGEDHLEIPLERDGTGSLTAACRQAVIEELRAFLSRGAQPREAETEGSRTEDRPGGGGEGRAPTRPPFVLGDFLERRGWIPRRPAFCAVGARGVSLRRLNLPPTHQDELQGLLAIQVEKEFPLSPERLAWGYRLLGPPAASGAGSGSAGHEVMVMAMRREFLEEYSPLLAECGLNPTFTLGLLAQSRLVPDPAGTYAVLDIGRLHSEWLVCEDGIPTTIRTLSWGGDRLTEAIQNGLQTGQDEAEHAKREWAEGAITDPQRAATISGAVRTELTALAERVRGILPPGKVYLSGKTARLPGVAERLNEALGETDRCQPLELPEGEVGSAALQGLDTCAGDPQRLPTVLEAGGLAEPSGSGGGPLSWKWAVLAASLLVLALALRYVEAYIKTPRIRAEITEIRQTVEELPEIDKELGFLQFLEREYPPYLNLLTLLAERAPDGSLIESLSMNRRGDLSLTATLDSPEQAIEFRSKLIESGLFSRVVIEEQAPDDRKTRIQLTAQWVPSGAPRAAPNDVWAFEPPGSTGTAPGRGNKAPRGRQSPAPSVLEAQAGGDRTQE